MTVCLQDFIANASDFPKPGVLFKDISPLLADPKAFSFVLAEMEKRWFNEIDVVVGLDARGFIFGACLALKMGLPFVMLRKKGKLPGKTFGIDYALEYGKATIEMQSNALPLGSRVLIVDDLLATGGTAAAACQLISASGAFVSGCAFVIELSALGGRKVLGCANIQSLVVY